MKIYILSQVSLGGYKTIMGIFLSVEKAERAFGTTTIDMSGRTTYYIEERGADKISYSGRVLKVSNGRTALEDYHQVELPF